MDSLAHTCLQEGANAATKNIYQFRHLDMEHCERWLKKEAPKAAEAVVPVTVENSPVSSLIARATPIRSSVTPCADEMVARNGGANRKHPLAVVRAIVSGVMCRRTSAE